MRDIGRALCLAILLAAGLVGCSDQVPTERRGEPDPPRAGSRLYITDQRAITAIDVSGGELRRIALPELAGGDWPFGLVRRGPRLVFPGRGGNTYSIDLRLRQAPVRLGLSRYFVPSGTENRIWLVARSTAHPRIREIDASGRVTAPDVPFPGGPYGLAGAAGREVVFWAKGGGFKLWDPATRRTVRTVRDGYYGSGDEDHLTWCRAADFGVLHLLELRSGRQSLVRPPAGFRAMECPAGVLSPDGEVLAVPVSRAKLGQFGDYGEPLSLALTDTITGRARVVPGSTVPAGYVYLAWASDGRTVFMSGGDRRRVIVAYTLDNERARRLPLQLGRFSIYGMAAS